MKGRASLLRTVGLLWVVASCTSSTTPPAGPDTAPPPAAVCTTPTRTSGVQLGANVNALFWEEHYGDTRLLGAVRSLGNPIVRFPGGTEADYFDWERGRPVDACRYGACRTWDNAQLTPPGLFQRFGAFRNSTAGGFVNFARQVDGTLLLVTNTVCVRPSHLDARRRQAGVLQEAVDQRCGSSSSMRLAGCVGSRSSTSLKYA